MAEANVISGLLGIGIDILAKQIIQRINKAVRCRKQLDSLNDLVIDIMPINKAMLYYRLGINSRLRNEFDGSPLPSAVNDWLKHLNLLLQEAEEMVQRCTIPQCNLIARYKTSTRITGIMTRIKGHLDRAALIGITNQLCQHLMLHHGFEGRDNGTRSVSASLSNNSPAYPSFKLIQEPLIVGQDKAFVSLVRLLVNDAGNSHSSHIGVVGMGGSGKTLLLKTVYNSKEVQNHFQDGVLAWLTASQNPSIPTLRSELATQIALQTGTALEVKEEDAKTWVHDKLADTKFALFLDDLWEGGAQLLESLGIPHTHNSKIVVSSRDNRRLLEIGVPASSIIAMEILLQNDSWELFSSYAFLHNRGNPPLNVEKTAKKVCGECGGLPLAIKVVGAAMAGVTDPTEWELTLERLKNSDRLKDPQVEKTLYDNLRLSYDALGRYDVALQICFLYMGAFRENQVMIVENLIHLWIGEGLLEAGDQHRGSYDLFQVGQAYVNLLVDRCLIEARLRDLDGNVVYCSMHDVLHDLAQQIAEREENCLFRSGRDNRVFPADQCVGRTRVSFMSNTFRTIPEEFRGSEIRSLLLSFNRHLTQLPEAALRSLRSLRVLDLTGTSLKTLPQSMGHLRNLVCLRLWYVPIERLPGSIVSLKNLEILDLACTKLVELPVELHRLTSLKYLDIRFCVNLCFMPYEISKLTSLHYLKMNATPNLWVPKSGGTKCRRRESRIKDLQSLTQLKCLQLQNNGVAVAVGTLGQMTEMKTLLLNLTDMTNLPPDMNLMAELKKLELRCSHLVRMDNSVCRFQHLTHLRLVKCENLEELPELHKLSSLRRLEIIDCGRLKKFPQEFGKAEAFPALEMLSLVWLNEAEELFVLEEGAMPHLTTLTIMRCDAMKMLPQGLQNLNELTDIQIYGCSWIDDDADYRENLVSIVSKMKQKANLLVLTRKDIDDFMEQFDKIYEGGKFWDYDECWRNKFFQFIQEIFI